MEIALTWNFVLFGGFLVLFAYNFLLGQNSTIKLILSIYVAIFTADGIVRILEKMGIGAEIFFANFTFLNFLRIAIFIVSMVIFVAKGGFHIKIEKHDHWAVRSAVHTAFSILSALFFLATLLIFLAGSSFFEAMILPPESTIFEQSIIAAALANFYQFWFSVPAIAFLAATFLFPEKD